MGMRHTLAALSRPDLSCLVGSHLQWIWLSYHGCPSGRHECLMRLLKLGGLLSDRCLPQRASQACAPAVRSASTRPLCGGWRGGEPQSVSRHCPKTLMSLLRKHAPRRGQIDVMLLHACVQIIVRSLALLREGKAQGLRNAPQLMTLCRLRLLTRL
mmetsp:Transcript_69098/g.202315  ORF Transcript_69098/g.202315 Transcript_69098/m.202315 type:complete len:156 (+) Transcript_69098:564-1031(+)